MSDEVAIFTIVFVAWKTYVSLVKENQVGHSASYQHVGSYIKFPPLQQ